MHSDWAVIHDTIAMQWTPCLHHSYQVHDIQKLNRFWNSESLQSRAELKIPLVTHSQPSSPLASRKNMAGGSDGANGRLVSSFDVKFPTSSSSTSTTTDCSKAVDRDQCDDGFSGEKTIASILSSADRQLKISREFAEKLAQKRYKLATCTLIHCCACVGVCTVTPTCTMYPCKGEQVMWHVHIRLSHYHSSMTKPGTCTCRYRRQSSMYLK